MTDPEQAKANDSVPLRDENLRGAVECETCRGHRWVCSMSGRAPCEPSESHRHIDPKTYMAEHDWVACPDCRPEKYRSERKVPPSVPFEKVIDEFSSESDVFEEKAIGLLEKLGADQPLSRAAIKDVSDSLRRQATESEEKGRVDAKPLSPTPMSNESPSQEALRKARELLALSGSVKELDVAIAEAIDESARLARAEQIRIDDAGYAKLYGTPMGVSEWIKHGKKYGYYGYWMDDIQERMSLLFGYTIEKDCPHGCGKRFDEAVKSLCKEL